MVSRLGATSMRAHQGGQNAAPAGGPGRPSQGMDQVRCSGWPPPGLLTDWPT